MLSYNVIDFFLDHKIITILLHYDKLKIIASGRFSQIRSRIQATAEPWFQATMYSLSALKGNVAICI